jgi:N-acetylneuraminic acid mutarotase
MHRVSAPESARLAALAGLTAIALALSGCSESQDLSGPQGQTPSFLVVPGSGTWTTKAPLPSPRAAPNAEVLNNILYVVGQDNAGVFTHVIETYDPLTDLWTPRAPMPTARGTIAVGVVNGILYAAGGWDGGNALSTNEAYDPNTDTWTTRAPMPTARRSLSGASVNGVLYAIGGSAPGVPCFSTVEAYDPVTDTWSTKTPMPTCRGSTGVGVVSGKIYVVGGSGPDGDALTTVEVYDPATGSWATKSPMPTGRAGVRVAVVNNILYAIGGTSVTVPYLATVEAYDQANDSWTPVASMPTARGYPGVAAVNGTIYVAGGFNPDILSVVEAFTPAYPFTGFFQPVDNPNIVNVAKAGSAIPVKFSLGSNLGLNILNSGSPSSARYTCGSGPSDAIEQTVTASNSGLQYDPTSNQYTYVWKTDKSWAGTCREFSLGLTDGTSHVALFQFK